MDSNDKDILTKVIRILAEKEEEKSPLSSESKSDIKPAIYVIEQLQKRKSLLSQKETFSEGDIVMWKDGLKNKRFPDYKQLCIITKLIEPVIIDKEDSTFIEFLDIEIGFITESDDFICYNNDSSRFQLYQEMI
ncbi:MAG: hypothetical protein M3R72_08105 [Bacteroidota bacterium]|nr:hypothetical protein [Bacteroidota bacterium]